MGLFTRERFTALATLTTLVTLAIGYKAAYLPKGEWTFFSYHPLFMTLAFVGCFGNSALVKKMGGYKNTKTHGITVWMGIFLSLAGLYVIYTNKNNHGKEHFTSKHGKFGMLYIVSVIGLGMFAGTVLHPDFGIAKTSKLIRKLASSHRASSTPRLQTQQQQQQPSRGP